MRRLPSLARASVLVTDVLFTVGAGAQSAPAAPAAPPMRFRAATAPEAA